MTDLTFALSSFKAMLAKISSLPIFLMAAIFTDSSLSSMATFLRTSSSAKDSFSTQAFLMELSFALKMRSYNTSASLIFSTEALRYLLSFASIAIHLRVSSSTTFSNISSTCAFFLEFMTTSAIDLLFSPSLSQAKLLTSKNWEFSAASRSNLSSFTLLIAISLIARSFIVLDKSRATYWSVIWSAAAALSYLSLLLVAMSFKSN